MIGKVLRSGGSTRGLVRYLFGPGERNEHVASRLVAGWDDVDRIAPDLTRGDVELRRLAGLLDAPNIAAGGGDRSIYHLILSSARAEPEKGLDADPALSDAKWAQIARDAVERVGLGGVRWVAVRHDEPGAEHVHVVATLANEQTGRRVHPRNDFYRLGEACRAAEDHYGLRSTAPRDRTSSPPVGRPEREKAARLGREPSREVLRREVRQAVARATSTSGFLEELRASGLLVRERLSPATGQLTGYAVAVPGAEKDAHGQAVFYSGGKLASDLTLPRVQARYGETPGQPPADEIPVAPRAVPSPVVPVPRMRLTPEQRRDMWQQASRAADEAVRVIRAHADDPRAAAAAAWAASDYLSGCARLVSGTSRSGPLEQAARELDRAAREQWGRTPAPTPAGQGLRAASGLLLAARMMRHDESTQLLELLAQVALLAEAIARMRQAQGRAQQADAARRAAEQVRTVAAQRTALPTATAITGRAFDEHRTQTLPPATRGRSR